MADVQAAMGRLLSRFQQTVCKKYAADMEKLAKANAPWTDQTGDARKLLKGVVLDPIEKEAISLTNEKGEAVETVEIGGENFIGVAIVHRKEYGKNLETANSGKYAILKPTVEHFRQGFFEAARMIFRGEVRGEY